MRSNFLPAGVGPSIGFFTGARLDAHDEYHRANEHRWGLPRLLARHPFRFASLVAAASLLLAAAPEARDFALRLLRDLPALLP